MLILLEHVYFDKGILVHSVYGRKSEAQLGITLHCLFWVYLHCIPQVHIYLDKGIQVQIQKVKQVASYCQFSAPADKLIAC